MGPVQDPKAPVQHLRKTLHNDRDLFPHPKSGRRKGTAASENERDKMSNTPVQRLQNRAGSLLELARKAQAMPVNRMAKEAISQRHRTIHEIFHTAFGHEQTGPDGLQRCQHDPCPCQPAFSMFRSEINEMISLAGETASLLEQARFSPPPESRPETQGGDATDKQFNQDRDTAVLSLRTACREADSLATLAEIDP